MIRSVLAERRTSVVKKPVLKSYHLSIIIINKQIKRFI